MKYPNYKKVPSIFILFVLFLYQYTTAQDSQNLNLIGEVKRADDRYSGSWSYVDEEGNEYALIGAKSGLAAYDINDPNLEELGFISGPATNWREVTVIENHAYVVTDVQGIGHTMQVIDLMYLPDSLHLLSTYSETFDKGHIIQKNLFEATPYVYINGTTTTEGVHILDISDPNNPQQVGLYNPGYYIHDCHVRNDILFACALNNVEVDLVDISDKTNPVLIGKIIYDGDNTHSCFTSTDGKYLFVADERDGQPGRIFNIEDLEDPYLVANYTANQLSLVHNPYIVGDFAYIAHNTEGLRIVDIADPNLPVEVAFYDTFDGPSGGFSGLWSACPFYPSGKIIGADRTRGLLIWEFEETYAARIYGETYDIITKEKLVFTEIVLNNLDTIIESNLSGKFAYGMLAGEYGLSASKDNYYPYSIHFTLAEKDSTFFKIPLLPVESEDGYVFGQVKDSTTLLPIVNATVEIESLGLSILTDSKGYFELVIPVGDHIITTSASNYIANNQDISLTKGQGENIEILLNSLSTDIENIHEKWSIDISPNPVSALINIEIKGNTRPYHLQIMDINGQLIHQNRGLGNQKTIINMEDRKKGAYFVQISIGSQSYTKKIIKH